MDEKFEQFNENKLVLMTLENKIAKIEFNSPKNNNALSPVMVEAITKAFDEAEINSEVHLILLYTRHRNFCSGADLLHMLSMFKKSYDENLLDAKQFAGVFLRIYNCKKPVICTVSGNITAGALGLMSVCDINVAQTNAKFSFPEVKLSGVPYSIAPFVIKRIGHTHAAMHMLAADTFDTKEAHRIGLIDHIAEDSLAKGLAIAQSIQANNVESMMRTKAWLRFIAPLDYSILEESVQRLAKMRMDPETNAAVERFVELNQ